MLKNSDSISYDVFMSILKYSDEESLKTMSLLSKETELLVRPRIAKCLSVKKTRKLYGDPFSFTPTFKLQLMCNKLPNIPTDDNATWRRIRVTPFPSKFIDEDDVDDIYPIEKIDFDVRGNENIDFHVLSNDDIKSSSNIIDLYNNSYKNKGCLVDQRG